MIDLTSFKHLNTNNLIDTEFVKDINIFKYELNKVFDLEKLNPNYFKKYLKICIKDEMDYNKFKSYAKKKNIKYIEENEDLKFQNDMQYFDNEFLTIPYQIDRLDQKKLPLDQKYNPPNYGDDIDIYIVDNGIYSKHIEFIRENNNKKVVHSFDYDKKLSVCANHGTLVASVVAGETIGVAKNVNIHDIDFSDYNNNCDLIKDGLLDGLFYILNNAKKNSIINMSWSVLGGEVGSIQILLKLLHEEGMILLTSSGNNGNYACNTFPSNLNYVFSIGSINSKDYLSSFSNTGNCVLYYLPGEGVYGALRNTKESYVKISGTSFSVAIATGEMAIILLQNKDLFKNNNGYGLMRTIIDFNYTSKNQILGNVENNVIIVFNNSNSKLNIIINFFLLIMF